MSELTGLEVIDVRLPGPGPSYSVDISRARQVLGYDPIYDLDRMLDEAASAYRKRQAAQTPPGA